jgi:hypothetical protein
MSTPTSPESASSPSNSLLGLTTLDALTVVQLVQTDQDRRWASALPSSTTSAILNLSITPQ